MRKTKLLTQVRASKPHILWVGLSTPKQERFMAHYVDRLEVPLFVGVGAAFDYHTGRIRDCPRGLSARGSSGCIDCCRIQDVFGNAIYAIILHSSGTLPCRC